MKILITGSSGYLGNIITKYLLEKGHYVVGLDINPGKESNQSPNYRFFPCCITDYHTLLTIVKEEQPTHILHLACTFNKVRNRTKELKVDCGGTRNLMEVSNKVNSVKQFIYFSSTAAYGANKENAEWISENQPLRPGRYRYGLNKKLAENVIFNHGIREDLNLVCLRVSSVVGPLFTKRKSAVSTIINWPFLLSRWANIRLQFLHEQDFIDLLDKVIHDRFIKGVYNLAPNSFVTVMELEPDKRYIPVPMRLLILVAHVLWFLRVINLPPASLKQSMYSIVLDPSKIISKYGYSFKYTSKQAFLETAKNYKLVSS